ncbi:MAG: RDD family protein [Rhodobacter sp.]|uniref:RDD family protein n=1 Tax=Pararhodobacter sp. TaxID=2127056 RepID=UPI001D9E0FAF|nr:RDD family protein [Pararhodobacter sp.]MCB1343735.1 RDD family protein [Paracoccaceae bacterium]MCB1410644.1 RDD family protein [Paracoccaceae bacterium]MCC0074111.1 RDD family protein [Rhodobacter sp.]HPD92361.1 RDD family protein [Pararhodobacter sp.]
MSLPHPEDDPAFYDHLIAKRFLAWVIDLLVTALLTLLVIVLTLGLAALVFPLVWAVIAVAYRTVMLTRYGATAGMLVAAVRLRRLDGRRPDSTLCLWHSALYSGSMIVFPVQIASVAMMLTTPYRQGLNDWILGTTILNDYVER